MIPALWSNQPNPEERRLRPRLAAPAHTGTVLRPEIGTAPVVQAPWTRDYRHLAVAADCVVILAANVLGLWLRFVVVRSPVEVIAGSRLSYRLIALALVLGWLVALAWTGSYEVAFLGTGSEEFKRIFNASISLTAAVALACYLSRTQVSRGYVATTLLLGTTGLLLGRYALRKYVHRLRRSGRWSHRVIAVGTRGAVAELVEQTRAAPYAGFVIVAACMSHGQRPLVFGQQTVPVVGSLSKVVDAVREHGADTVAVTRAPAITTQWLTELGWQLEDSGIGLVVAPALTNVAGPRIAIRPVAGLPLMQVEEPELRGFRRMVKEVVERAAASLTLLLLAPVLFVIAVGIRLDTPGPVVFRQRRVGQDGNTFWLLKFRSMRRDAERVHAEVAHLNEADAHGVLFKIRRDPRVTRIGRALRRYSIDELPQLINVVRGQMALVGPRPPLPDEVERYGPNVHRRLRVKPGITGLWQVSGRADLSWDDAIRLDLYYVENWSLVLDLQILWKTLFAVLGGRGAY